MGLQDVVRARLEYYYNLVSSLVLIRQHPFTGLLPASTAVTAHGDYRDAWVRDNVYSCVLA
jgi:phosphorylase kinase alpha/beta subunit